MQSNVKLFLDLIAFSEGTSTASYSKNLGYDVLVRGKMDNHDNDLIFTNYSRHPFEVRRPKIVRYNPLLESTAAGRYQIILPTWRNLKQTLHLPDFTPFSQDCCAVELIKEHGALAQIENGVIEAGVFLCSKVWASFPGNDYNQPGGKSMEVLLAQFERFKTPPPLTKVDVKFNDLTSLSCFVRMHKGYPLYWVAFIFSSYVVFLVFRF